MQIIIQPNSSPQFSLEVQPSDNVYSVKLIIQARENIVPEDQRLLFQGNHLVDDDILVARGIQDGSTIHLIRTQ